MKKIIFLLAAATMLAAACDKNEGEPKDEPSFTKENVTVKITVAGGKADIEMFKVKFAEAMPVTLDMTIPGVTAAETAGGVSLSGDGIVPQAMGNPFPAYTITGLEGTLTDSAISFEMMCGEYPTSFSGTAAEEEGAYTGTLTVAAK